MKATPSSTARNFQADNHSLRGIPANQFGDRALVVFHLGHDVGSLNPRFQLIARKLLLRMNRKKWSTSQS